MFAKFSRTMAIQPVSSTAQCPRLNWNPLQSKNISQRWPFHMSKESVSKIDVSLAGWISGQPSEPRQPLGHCWLLLNPHNHLSTRQVSSTAYPARIATRCMLGRLAECWMSNRRNIVVIWPMVERQFSSSRPCSLDSPWHRLGELFCSRAWRQFFQEES